MSSRTYLPLTTSDGTSAKGVLSRSCLMLAAMVASACSPTPPPLRTAAALPPATTTTVAPLPLPPRPIDTGKDCATATRYCDAGLCRATLQNYCDTPITCELDVLARCQAAGTLRDARGTGRATIPARADGKLAASADCHGGQLVFTVTEGLACR
jgi:hypothetical protein